MSDITDEAFDAGYEAGVKWALAGDRPTCPYPTQSAYYVEFYNALHEAVEELRQEHEDNALRPKPCPKPKG